MNPTNSNQPNNGQSNNSQFNNTIDDKILLAILNLKKIFWCSFENKLEQE